VFADSAESRVVPLEVRHNATLDRLEENSHGAGVDGMFLLNRADCALNRFLLVELRCDEIIDDLAGVVRMEVTLLDSSEVSFEAVATVEEFADVPTDVVVEYEPATWVVVDEAIDV